MEPLWSPVVATGGNQRQIDYARKRGKQAKSVAVDCHRLPATFHGKEGVSGSSPEEGSWFREVPANPLVALPSAVPQSTSLCGNGTTVRSPAADKAPANRHVARYHGAPPGNGGPQRGRPAEACDETA